MRLPPSALVISILVCLLLPHALLADCIDYGDYIHWVSGFTPPDYAQVVVAAGDYAYVACQRSLQVLDISDPASPSIVGSLSVPPPASDIALFGDYVYMACIYAGLLVVDITNPHSPQITGAVSTPGHASRIALAGDYAYVADRSSGLQVIDIADPANPRIVGHVKTPGEAWYAAVEGDWPLTRPSTTWPAIG